MRTSWPVWGALLLAVACGESDTRYEGDVVILSADDLAQLEGVRHITGDLVLRGAGLQGELALPELEHVEGSIVVHETALSGLRLPLLTQVGRLSSGDNAQLAQLELSALREVNVLDFTDSPALTELTLPEVQHLVQLTLGHGLEHVSLPALETLHALSATSSTLRTLEAPALHSVASLYLNELQSLSALRLPALTQITGTAILRVAPLVSLELPSLREVQAMYIRDVEALSVLDLGALERAGEFDWESGGDPFELNLPSLREVGRLSISAEEEQGGEITLQLPQLEEVGWLWARHLAGTLELPNLVQGGSLWLGGPALTEIAAPKLSRVGEIALQEAPLLTHIDLSVLKQAGEVRVSETGLGCDASVLLPALPEPERSVRFATKDCP